MFTSQTICCCSHQLFRLFKPAMCVCLPEAIAQISYYKHQSVVLILIYFCKLGCLFAGILFQRFWCFIGSTDLSRWGHTPVHNYFIFKVKIFLIPLHQLFVFSMPLQSDFAVHVFEHDEKSTLKLQSVGEGAGKIFWGAKEFCPDSPKRSWKIL